MSLLIVILLAIAIILTVASIKIDGTHWDQYAFGLALTAVLLCFIAGLLL